MKIKEALFMTSAPDLDHCPEHAAPEFAFIGRSNVGKSSLINLLTEKKDLAKVSATPGKTRLLNFFAINQAWCLVDLPGYGYAKVARVESADFNEAVANYLENRENLKRTFVLIDSNLPPQKIDIQFLRWLDEVGLEHALIFTKADRQSPTATRKSIAAFSEVLAELGLAMPPVIACSSKTKDGRQDILRLITEDLGLQHAPRKRIETSDTAAPSPTPAKPAQVAKPAAPKRETFKAHKAEPTAPAKKPSAEDGDLFGAPDPARRKAWRP